MPFTIVRTIPEQVSKNESDIKALQAAYIGGVDVAKIDFEEEDLSDSPDFISTLPDSSMDLNDVQSELARSLLLKFIKKGYIFHSGDLNKLFVVGVDDSEIRTQFGFYYIVLTATRYEISI